MSSVDLGSLADRHARNPTGNMYLIKTDLFSSVEILQMCLFHHQHRSKGHLPPQCVTKPLDKEKEKGKSPRTNATP